MDKDFNTKYDKKGGSGINILFSKVKKSLKGSFHFGRKKPKVYRPFLGHNIDPEKLKEIQEEGMGDSGYVDYYDDRGPRRRKRTLSTKIREYKRHREQKIEKKRRKKYERKILKKQRKEYRKSARIEFIRKFYPNYRRSKENIFDKQQFNEESADEAKFHFRNYYFYTINSTALFIISYLLVYFTYQLTVLITASRWKLDSVLFYYDLVFNDYSPLWTKYNILLVTFSGPFISLIIGFLFFRFFSIRPKVRGFLKLFFLWIALHGFNFFFGAFASGVAFSEGFGYVPEWLSFNVFWQILVSLLFLFILGLIGFYTASRFLDTSNSAYRVRDENKLKFLFYQVFLPGLFGTTLILLVKIPNNLPYDMGNLVTLVFAIVPVMFNRYARPTIAFVGDRRPTQIKWNFIAIFVILLLAFRIGLNNGLHISLYYKFIFSLEISPL